MNKKPVELWKGIVGTALSGTLLLVITPFIFIFTIFGKEVPLWANVTIITCTAVLIVSLILSLINLTSTINYKREQRNQKQATSETKEETTELLHKLLAEGKITIEEYDKLKQR